MHRKHFIGHLGGLSVSYICMNRPLSSIFLCAIESILRVFTVYISWGAEVQEERPDEFGKYDPNPSAKTCSTWFPWKRYGKVHIHEGVPHRYFRRSSRTTSIGMVELRWETGWACMQLRLSRTKAIQAALQLSNTGNWPHLSGFPLQTDHNDFEQT